MKKKHAPIEELRKAKEYADEYFVKKGMILPKEKSVVDKLLKKGKLLPGRHLPYIPYPWVINASKRVLFDLLIQWKELKSNKDTEIDDAIAFFKFVVKQLESKEREIKTQIRESAKKKEYDIKLYHKKDAANGVKTFIIDSFAVAVIAKSNTSVVEYSEWFLDWSKELLKNWNKNIRGVY